MKFNKKTGEWEADADRCQEAGPLTHEKYVPCNKSATKTVGFKGEGPYRMCEMCAHHNIYNRGATDMGPYIPEHAKS